MNKRWIRVLGVFGILFVLFAHCSYYSFKGSLPPHLETVAVALFENQTSEFGLAENLTDYVIDEFTRDGSLSLADASMADVLIEGTILSVRDQAGTVTANESVRDIKVYITVNVACTDQVKRQEMWQSRITKFGIYDPAEGSQARQQAYEQAYEEISEDILNKTVENW